MAAVNVTFPGNLAQVETADDLRDLPSALISRGIAYIVADLLGIFLYDPGSMAADNGTTVLKPDDKAPGLAGRWIFTASGFARGPSGAPGGNVLSVGAKTTLNMLPVAAGTTLVQTDSYNGNGTGAALYSSGMGATSASLAKHPRAMFQAADGRIFAHVKSIPSISDFGAVGDNSTDDYPAIWAAMEWCTELGEPELIIPRGQGYCSQQFEVDKPITIRGNGTGRAGVNVSKSILRFPDSQSAFTIHTAITSPRSGQPGITGAEGSRFLGIKTILGTTSRTTRHYWMRARSEIAQCVMEYGGAGVRIAAGAGSGGDTEGNANSWSVHDCRIDTTRGNALQVQFGDANTGSAYDLDIVGNSGFAVLGIPFLSTGYYNIHTASNGTFAGRRGGTFAGVNHVIDGIFHFFVPHYAATPTQLGANAPTLANDQIWMHVYAAANAAFPIWQSGNTDYMPGGPFAFDGPLSAELMYSESDQGPGQVHGVAELANGTHAAGIVGRGCYRYVQAGVLGSRRGFIARDPSLSAGRYSSMGDELDTGAFATWNDPTIFSLGMKWRIDGTDLILSHGNGNAYVRIGGPTSATPGSLQSRQLIAPGPYADDAAAATAGVPVNGAYNKTGVGVDYRRS